MLNYNLERSEYVLKLMILNLYFWITQITSDVETMGSLGLFFAWMFTSRNQLLETDTSIEIVDAQVETAEITVFINGFQLPLKTLL